MNYQNHIYRNLNQSKLANVAKRLRVNRQVIVSLLNDNGFKINNNPFQRLNSQHLGILSLSFSKAVINLFNDSVKIWEKSQIIDEREFEFYSKFIKNSDTLNADNFYQCNLDIKLINEYFIDLIYQPIVTNQIRFISKVKILYRLNYKIKTFVSNLRKKAGVIIKTHHFYIFIGEDEFVDMQPINKFRFS